MSKRSNAYYRYQRARHILKKKNIIKKRCNYWHIKFDGMLSKGEIHCSCMLCTFTGKTASDLRKEGSMQYKEKEYSNYF